MLSLPLLLSPIGLVLWYAWNFAVLSSIQLTVRLIRAFSIRITALGALALTIGTVPIALLYRAVFDARPAWFPVPMLLTAVLGYVVAKRVLRIKRQRGRVVSAIGTALLSAPWPIFIG